MTAAQVWWRDTLTALALCVVVALVYANTLEGEWVYDDVKQIVGNELIRDPALFGRAMLSDVWAFRGPAERSASLYWRPTFILWLVVNDRLFGLHGIGWHAGNILLHALATALGYLWVRRLGQSWPVAASIGLLFAVHPVHVGSVAWVSGSPDLLMTVLLLPALWLAISAAQRGRLALLGWACALYGLGVGTKEVTVVFPALVFCSVCALQGAGSPPPRWGARLRRACLYALPFAIIAGGYLAGRSIVLGQTGLSRPLDLDLVTLWATLPSIVAFYLRQTFFPLWIGPGYPIRYVMSPGLSNVALPLVAVVAAAVVAWWLVRGHPVRQIGAAIFAWTLLPALNIRGFFLEHLVQDRYVYLPVLGAMMVVVPALADLLQRLLRDRPRGERTLLVLLTVASLPLAYQTWRYNHAWLNEQALWEWAVRSDPTSAANYNQLGIVYLQAGRLQESLDCYNRALEIAPFKNAYGGRSGVLLALGRPKEALADAQEVLDRYGPDFGAYERIAIANMALGRPDVAEATLRRARGELPQNRAALTMNLATVLYQVGRKEDALRELESAREAGATEYGPAARLVLHRLGMLYAEMRRGPEAVVALEAFMKASEPFANEPQIRAAREAASRVLAQLRARS